MRRYFVESSALQSVGYDEQTLTLELEFRDKGGVWRYDKFPKREFNKFIHSDSMGRFFATKIKGNYPETKIE